jgi:hypothetical protein
VVGWHTLESTVVDIWFRWSRVRNAQDGGGLIRRIYLRWDCVFGARVGYDEDSCKQEMEQVLVGRWRHGLEDMDMRARQVILDRLEWSVTLGGRFVSGSAPGNAGRSDAIHMCLRWRHPLSLLAHTMISQQWRGPRCMKSFHEMHNFRCSYFL